MIPWYFISNWKLSLLYHIYLWNMSDVYTETFSAIEQQQQWIHTSTFSSLLFNPPLTNFQEAIVTVKSQHFELLQYILISYDTLKKSIVQISSTPKAVGDKQLQTVRICYYLISTIWLFVRREPSLLFCSALCAAVPPALQLQLSSLHCGRLADREVSLWLSTCKRAQIRRGSHPTNWELSMHSAAATSLWRLCICNIW